MCVHMHSSISPIRKPMRQNIVSMLASSPRCRSEIATRISSCETHVVLLRVEKCLHFVESPEVDYPRHMFALV